MKTIKLHQQRAFVSKTDRFFFLNVVSHDYRFKICLTVAFGAPIAKVRGYSRGNVPRTGDVYRTHNKKLIQGFFPQMGLFSNESKREQLRNYSFAQSIKLKIETKKFSNNSLNADLRIIYIQSFLRTWELFFWATNISQMNHLIGSGVS